MTMTRKEFLHTVAGAAGLAAVVGCGGSDDKTVDAPPGVCTTPVAAVATADGHSHTVTVPIADVNAGVEKTYTLSDVGHTHMITITAAQFTMIKAMTPVTVTSTNSTTHNHMVMISCPS
jgi:hypothetical protein